MNDHREVHIKQAENGYSIFFSLTGIDEKRHGIDLIVKNYSAAKMLIGNFLVEKMTLLDLFSLADGIDSYEENKRNYKESNV